MLTLVMNQATRREFLKQASADLAALALLPILPSGDKFWVVGSTANGEAMYNPISFISETERWCSLEELVIGEVVTDREGDIFLFTGDGALRSLFKQ